MGIERLREELAGYSGPAKVLVRNGLAVMVKTERGGVRLDSFDALEDLILDMRWGEIDMQVKDGELVEVCRSERQVKLAKWVE